MHADEADELTAPAMLSLDCHALNGWQLLEKLGKEISANAFEKMVHAIGAVTFVTEPAIKIIHSELESVNKTEKLRLNLDVLHRKR